MKEINKTQCGRCEEYFDIVTQRAGLCEGCETSAKSFYNLSKKIMGLEND